MQKDLNIASGNLQWLVSAYTLAFGGFLLLAGYSTRIFSLSRLLTFVFCQGGGRSIRQEDDLLRWHGLAYDLVTRRLLRSKRDQCDHLPRTTG